MALANTIVNSYKKKDPQMGQPRQGPERKDEPKSIATKWVDDFPGGHQKYINNDPPQELNQHPSGTSTFTDEDGSQTHVVAGNHINYNKKGYTLTVDENGDITVHGHARISVGGGAHVEIKGDCDMVVTGNWTQTITGNMKQVVVGDMTSHVGGQHVIAAKSVDHYAAEGMKQTAGGAITAEAKGGEFTIASSAEIVHTGPRVSHEGKNIGKDHKHTEVISGADLTGIPTA